MTASPTTRPLVTRTDDGQIELNFHPGQASVWRRNERFVFAIAGSQSGKTSFGPWWLWREIQRCGAGDYLAVTASYDLFQLKMLPELRHTFEGLLGIGRYKASSRIIEICNPETGTFASQDGEEWARIILRSAVSGGGLESATAKAAWLDECGQDEFTVETWEAVLRRLALYQGRVLGTTTPYNLGFLKHEVYDRWHDGHDPLFAVVNFSSLVNPLYPQAEYDRAKATMPTWRFNMFIRGVFERPPGLIYDCFDQSVHVIDDFDIPGFWPRYVGVDFGGVNHAMLWVAQNPTTRACYAYRESLTADMTTNERASEAKSFLANENVAGWYGGAPSEGQQRMDWRAAGVQVKRPGVSDLEGGINRVTELIKEQRFFVFRSLSGLLDEFGTYRRKLDDRGETTIDIVDKRTFHRLDALRYVAPALTSSDGGAAPVVPDRPRAYGQSAGSRQFGRG